MIKIKCSAFPWRRVSSKKFSSTVKKRVLSKEFLIHLIGGITSTLYLKKTESLLKGGYYQKNVYPIEHSPPE